MLSLLFSTHHTDPNQIQPLLEKKLARQFLNNPDVTEINRAGESFKIATVRELKNEILYPPLKEKSRLIILYNFHLATIPAQNALLKSLEEPPYYIQFVLVCTNLNSILPTIKSRCSVHMLEDMEEEENQQKNQDFTDIAKIYKQIIAGSFADKIKLVSGYKSKTEAMALLENLLTFLHQQNIAQPTPALTQHLQILDEHLVYLRGNSNVALTLEEGFFKITNEL